MSHVYKIHSMLKHRFVQYCNINSLVFRTCHIFMLFLCRLHPATRSKYLYLTTAVFDFESLWRSTFHELQCVIVNNVQHTCMFVTYSHTHVKSTDFCETRKCYLWKEDMKTQRRRFFSSIWKREVKHVSETQLRKYLFFARKWFLIFKTVLFYFYWVIQC